MWNTTWHNAFIPSILKRVQRWWPWEIWVRDYNTVKLPTYSLIPSSLIERYTNLVPRAFFPGFGGGAREKRPGDEVDVTLFSYLGDMLGNEGWRGRWLFTDAKGLNKQTLKSEGFTEIKSFLWCNRPFPISKNSHFQNESKCKTFLVKMPDYHLH